MNRSLNLIRTGMAAGLVFACVGSAQPAMATAPVPTTQPVKAARTVVNMEATVKAAQIDPRRRNSTRTPGAKASVMAVERALAAKGLLANRWVDGYYGTLTVKAYAKYQASLGYRGVAANGLPGRTSLTKLGKGRFVVTRLLSAGARVAVRDGVVVNKRTQSMLVAAERRLDRRLVLTQGSYNPGGDPTSAGTHDGGGVVDISVRSMNSTTRSHVVRQLRKVGFAAWLRRPSQGDWPLHIHAVAISDTDLSSQAQHQAGDYYLGLNGLANRRSDDGPKVRIRTWEEYLRRQ